MHSKLFKGIKEEELSATLHCIGARSKKYKRNEQIISAGHEVTSIGLIIEGMVQIHKEDLAGNRIILMRLVSGELFGEALASKGEMQSPVTVIAAENCEIMFISIKKILSSCSSACKSHQRIVANLLKIIAEKNIMLNEKNDILSKRSIREKLMAYFYLQMQKYNKRNFIIPFNRDELADYLCVNRSAMSRELCRMQEAGLIDFKKNEFFIL